MEHIIAFSQLCCCENVSDRLRQTTVLNDSNIRYQDGIYMQQKLYYVIVYSMIHSENSLKIDVYSCSAFFDIMVCFTAAPGPARGPFLELVPS